MHQSVGLSEGLAQHAVNVAPHVWWVGAVLDGDPFQCHAYLVEAGPHSVLIDPGSTLTIGDTLHKVQEVVTLDDIEWIVIHHSDPDVADALHVLSTALTRTDVRVVTEWRSGLLLKHFAARFPMVTIEDLGWRLDVAEGQTLEFLLTPYLHFPGAFVTFEPATQSLFSADLFGGFNRAGRLWAELIADFEDLRQFHEHYMPSREILMAGLATITARFPHIERVLPQHGYCIPEPLVAPMFEQLGQLECGVMLASRSDTHLARLLAAAAAVRRIEHTLELPIALGEALELVANDLRSVLPLDRFWVEVGAPPNIVRFDVDHPNGIEQTERSPSGPLRLVLDLPDGHDEPHVAVVLETSEHWDLANETMSLLAMLAARVHHVADEALAHRDVVAREAALRSAALTDALTGLGNRRAFDQFADVPVPAAVLMIDIDRFKQINDHHGHPVGDRVLRAVADALQASLRRADRAFRYGGEEFVAVVELDPHVSEHDAARAIGERVRAGIAHLDHRALGVEAPVTVSVGAALVHPEASLQSDVRRADEALYAAKHTGRNRVVLLPG
ncbi:MAG: hypothetical protein RL238_3780 [Actinomycetota bacterium]